MVKLIIEFILFGCLAVFLCSVSWIEMPNAKDKKTGRNVLYINVYVQLIDNCACSFSWELQRQQLRYQLRFSFQVFYPTSTLFRSRILAKGNASTVDLADSYFCILDRQYYCWYEYVEYGTMKCETILLQSLGFTRESATYIRTNTPEALVVLEATPYLNPCLLESVNINFRKEVK